MTKLTDLHFNRSATHHQLGLQPSGGASRAGLEAACVEPGGSLPERLIDPLQGLITGHAVVGED